MGLGHRCRTRWQIGGAWAFGGKAGCERASECFGINNVGSGVSGSNVEDVDCMSREMYMASIRHDVLCRYPSNSACATRYWRIKRRRVCLDMEDGSFTDV